VSIAEAPSSARGGAVASGPERPPGATKPRARHAWLPLRRPVLGPAVGVAALVVTVHPAEPVHTALLGAAAFAGGAALARRIAPQAALLPLMRHVQPLLGPLLAVTGLALLELLTGRPHAGVLDLLAALTAGAFLDGIVASALGTQRPGSVRAAYIGTAPRAARLARALAAGGSSRYRLVGRVSCGPGPSVAPVEPDIELLGSLDGLGELVRAHELDLLVVGTEAPRLDVYGRMADTCLELPVRLVELSALFEEVFGHVPTAEINPTWFQWLACSETRSSTGALKRVFDVTVAAVLLTLLAPLVGALVLLIRRDGGRGVFAQVRIGERGRPFRLYKLRSMRVGADSTAQWAAVDDPRITRLGALLRSTHLDEIPQLVNVLRGEMSLVGPRPEQPAFVDRLERMLPFYQRRHLMRPGITGWAQVRCGYAGSDVGSAWKLCHDLYYARHRSFGLDLLILCETLLTLIFVRDPVLSPESFAYVVPEHTP
jgi:exopolysaccharide biosynthesis polyprenyl glycosylphosphotransferase